jgi:hypothetical protein
VKILGQFSMKFNTMTFDQARTSFSDGSLDLLPIDGTHTYEAVRHDFENWLPALSKRAVVLFHDTNVRSDGFGVWRLWEELRTRYPAFSFLHSHGLGVLGVGPEQPQALQALFGMTSDPQAVTRVRNLFASRSGGLIERLDASQAETRFRAVLDDAAQRESALRAQSAAELNAAKAEADQRESALRAQTAAALHVVKAEADQRESALRAQITAELHAVKAEADQRESALRAQVAAELDAVRAEADQRVSAVRGQTAAELKAAIARAQREIVLRARASAELKAATAAVEQRERAMEARMQVVVGRMHAVEAEASQLRAIEQSTMWQALHPVRMSLRFVPDSMRRFGRFLLRLTWWTLTLQLSQRLRK